MNGNEFSKKFSRKADAMIYHYADTQFSETFQSDLMIILMPLNARHNVSSYKMPRNYFLSKMFKKSGACVLLTFSKNCVFEADLCARLNHGAWFLFATDGKFGVILLSCLF